jgi:hypothetical protein
MGPIDIYTANGTDEQTYSLNTLKIILIPDTADGGNDLCCSAVTSSTFIKGLDLFIAVRGSCSAICWGA